MVEYDDLHAELLATFEAELAEHLATLNGGLLSLEKQPVGEEGNRVVTGLFRAAHSVKGAARAVGLEQIGTMAHAMEDVFRTLQRGEIDPSAEVIDTLLPVVDALSDAMSAHKRDEELPSSRIRMHMAQLKDLSDGKQPSPPDTSPSRPAESAMGTPTPPPSLVERRVPGKTEESAASRSGEAQHPAPELAAASDMVRVATAKIDAMMNGSGELLVARMHTDQRLSEFTDVRQQLSQLRRDWRRVRPQISQLRRRHLLDPELASVLDFFAESERRLDDLDIETAHLHQGLTQDAARLNNLAEDFQDGARRLRMLPMGSMFDSFPRMIRDLAREEGKSVELHILGAEAEIDRTVLELLKDPLIHLLRNAVGHGIESPLRRTELGKPAMGTISLEATQAGNSILVRVRDDGGGIDLPAVRRRAIALGAVSERALSQMEDREVMDLVFAPGFSTAAITTRLSGRGVGLDVVRENVTRMDGTIRVETMPGAGTTFTMQLPLTLATRHVLLVEVANQIVALPVSAVERIQSVRSTDVGRAEGRQVLRAEGRPVPIVSLSSILEFESEPRNDRADGREMVVIVGAADQRVAFRIDGVRNTHQVVVKSLGRRLHGIKRISGAAILGSGDVVIVLNPSALVLAARESTDPPSERLAGDRKDSQTTILVVDDSITTRTLERSILEREGYRVLVAADGLEGWNAVRSEDVDLVVSDVDMPRMTGVELTRRIRGLPVLAGLPVVLLTSLDSEDHRLQGLEAGANAYLSKGAFDQKGLLETITSLMGEVT